MGLSWFSRWSTILIELEFKNAGLLGGRITGVAGVKTLGERREPKTNSTLI